MTLILEVAQAMLIISGATILLCIAIGCAYVTTVAIQSVIEDNKNKKKGTKKNGTKKQ